MLDSSTSLSLLERLRGQNEEAWSRMVYLYSPLVNHWCRAWQVQEADMEDIRQEVFQAVAANMGTFRRDRPGDTFRGWLRVITHRKFLDHCRRRQSQPIVQGGSSANLQLLQVAEP